MPPAPPHPRRTAPRCGVLCALFLLLPLPAGADGIAAFPGALGFGAVSTGGRGGPVLHVTTLQPQGPGSIRWALQERTGPRIVVFDVGGRIRLPDEIRVNGQVTILGQTAPGDGITLEGGRLVVTGDDVIIRGLRLRPGTGPGQDRSARDGLSIGTPDRTVRRVMVDGNTLSWATDENASTWYRVEEVTWSHNLIAEGLLHGGHGSGRHSMGMLIGERTARISVLRNLFISNFWRNPQVADTTATEVVNNLIYNHGPGGIHVSGDGSRVDIIGNVLIAGPDTPEPLQRPAIELDGDGPGTAYFLQDNRTPMGPDKAMGDGLRHRVAAAVVAGTSGTPALPSGLVRRIVAAAAGAQVPRRDPADRRLLADLAGDLGHVPDAAWDRIDWRPAPARWPAARDRDGDGLPDTAEARLGTDPGRADSARIDPATGYAYIELYANALIPR